MTIMTMEEILDLTDENRHLVVTQLDPLIAMKLSFQSLSFKEMMKVCKMKVESLEWYLENHPDPFMCIYINFIQNERFPDSKSMRIKLMKIPDDIIGIEVWQANGIRVPANENLENVNTPFNFKFYYEETMEDKIALLEHLLQHLHDILDIKVHFLTGLRVSFVGGIRNWPIFKFTSKFEEVELTQYKDDDPVEKNDLRFLMEDLIIDKLDVHYKIRKNQEKQSELLYEKEYKNIVAATIDYMPFSSILKRKLTNMSITLPKISTSEILELVNGWCDGQQPNMGLFIIRVENFKLEFKDLFSKVHGKVEDNVKIGSDPEWMKRITRADGKFVLLQLSESGLYFFNESLMLGR